NQVSNLSTSRSKLNLCLERCFFFQAEDGIRDRNVTGVQTCALPISLRNYTFHASALLGILLTFALLIALLLFIYNVAMGVKMLQIGRASCRERVKIAVVAGAL